MIVILEIIFLMLIGFPLSYLAFLSCCAMSSKKRQSFHTSRMRRFALVIPAHNEERMIERTLRSLAALDYPEDLYEVIVVADNCSDGTANAARNTGATVYERTNSVLRGKGFALSWCFDILAAVQVDYDAVAIVDADSSISRNFLTVMNYYLEQDKRVIQSSDMVNPQAGSWSSEITRLGFTLYNYVRPLGRRVVGCSAGLRGNGMCFAFETLRRVPWKAYSLAEDLEHGLELLLNGISVHFAPEAGVLATMPNNAADAVTQRARWEIGRFAVIRKYAPLLLRSLLKRPSFRTFDAIVDLLIAPVVHLMMAAAALVLIHIVLWGLDVTGARSFLLSWIFVISAGAIHLLVGLCAAQADRELFKALLYVPRYGLWKLKLYFNVFFHGRTKEWIRTKRDDPVAEPGIK